MPPVLVGIAVVAATYGTVGLITAVGIGMAAAALYSVAVMKPPSVPGIDPQNAKQTIRSANEPFRGVYGDYVGSGPIIYAEEFLHPSGYEEEYRDCSGSRRWAWRKCKVRTRWVDTSQKWLHIVIALAGHPIHRVEEVYFNDEIKEEWDHEFWRINVMDGTQSSIEDIPQLLRQVPSWTDNMVGKGIAFLHVALRHSAEHFPSGIPNIKVKMKGAVLDTPFFKGYTNNAAAVIYDYLVNHFNVPASQVSVDNFAEEFAICNEEMAGEEYGGRTRKRYEIDGGFSYDETHSQVLGKMKSACAGEVLFVHGKYYLQVGAYRGPVPQSQSIELDDLAGPVSIATDTPLTERINKVNAQFLDAERDYQVNDMEPVFEQAYINQDGEERPLDMNLEFVTSPFQAQRLAKIALKDNRMGLTLDLPLNYSGLKYNVGLPVKFNDPNLGYDELEFRVVNWNFEADRGLKLVLKQTSPDIFDDAVRLVSPKPTAPNLPDPRFCFPVENLEFYEFEEDGAYNGTLLWSHPDPSSISSFNITVTSESGEVFRHSTSGAMEYRLDNLRGVKYTISVVAVNLYRGVSEPTKITQVIGAVREISEVRLIPDNFSITILPSLASPGPSDLEFFFFRANSLPADIENSTFLGQGLTFSDIGRSPKTTYAYFVQPVTRAAGGEIYGPYSATTTDDPKDIWDVIQGEVEGMNVWRVWAEDAFGRGISTEFDSRRHKFMGIAYNKVSEEPSLNPADYVFTRIADFISPEDQEILDNLAQGKLPDGSGELPSKDDILFKPGDKVTETHIADDSISTPKLKANSITADKLSANSVTAVKIVSGEIISRHIRSDQILANHIKANEISARHIQAGSITADKIAVTAVHLVNNFTRTGDLQGWNHQGSPVGVVREVTLNSSLVQTLRSNSRSSLTTHTSDPFPIEDGSIYEISTGLYNAQTSNRAVQYVYVRLFDANGNQVHVTRLHPETLQVTSSGTPSRLWEGFVRGWRHLKAYIVTDSADARSAPKSINVDAIIKAPSSAVSCEVIYGIPATSNAQACHFYSPNVTKLGSGEIVANTIRAGSEITAPVITGGKVKGTLIYGATTSGGSLVTDTTGILALSEYNQELYGTMNLEQIVESSRQPYLGRLLLPRTLLSPINVERQSSGNLAVEQRETQQFNLFGSLNTLRAYNNSNISDTNRLLRKHFGCNLYISLQLSLPENQVHWVNVTTTNNPKLRANTSLSIGFNGGPLIWLGEVIRDRIFVANLSGTATVGGVVYEGRGWTKVTYIPGASNEWCTISIEASVPVRNHREGGYTCQVELRNGDWLGNGGAVISGFRNYFLTARLDDVFQNFD